MEFDPGLLQATPPLLRVVQHIRFCTQIGSADVRLPVDAADVGVAILSDPNDVVTDRVGTSWARNHCHRPCVAESVSHRATSASVARIGAGWVKPQGARPKHLADPPFAARGPQLILPTIQVFLCPVRAT